MKYVVRDPSGTAHEIEAPEGASDADLIALAQQKATAPAPAPAPAAVAPAPEKKSIWDMVKPEMFGGLNEAIEKLGYRTGGDLTDKLSKIAPPEVAAGAGYGMNVLTQAAATMLGATGGKVAEPLAQAGAKSVMHNALKPNVRHDLLEGRAARAIDSMLEEGITVGEGGLRKLQGKIGELRNEIMQKIAGSNATIDKNAVAAELNNTIKKFSETATPNANLKTIENAWTEFLQHPLFSGQQVPVQLMQDIKQGTHSMLRKSYGEMKGAEIEAQKALARGMRQEIEKAVPGIAALNERQSAQLDARLLTELRLHGEKNKDPGGMAFLANSAPQALGWLAARSSWLKSLLAQGMYRGAPTTGAAIGGAVGSRMGEE